MMAVFQAHDSDDYANFDCRTCHDEDSWEMPSALLPRLDPQDEYAAHDQPKVKFMMREVVPKMAELLKEQPFDPARAEGFGCFECHQKK